MGIGVEKKKEHINDVEMGVINPIISPSKNNLFSKKDYLPAELLEVAESSTSDSLCTRYIRKKFFCIIAFLCSIIAVMQVLNTIASKLSGDDITSMYGNIFHLIEKINDSSLFSNLTEHKNL